VRLRIFVEPQQGASYDEQLAVAREAEALGFDAFFRSDHFLRFGGGDPRPGPTDTLVTLAGLARDTTRIRLGTLVASATFRWPGVLAVAAAQVDAMSGGRLELGLGTGWFEDEHRALGVPFPSLGERYERLEEQLAILTGLWATPPRERFEHRGRHYVLEGNPGLPKPAQEGGVPLIVGGSGLRRTPRLAARYAAEHNTSFVSLDTFVAARGAADEACRALGRDPASLRRSAALTVCVGADEAELARRAAAIGRDPDELRATGVAGTVPQAVATLSRWAEAGAEAVYLQVLDLRDLDHLRLLAAEVAPRLR